VTVTPVALVLMPADRKANPSLFSGVFKFVSRELEHFVANATGSSLPVRFL
jgi:hypothetical protein